MLNVPISQILNHIHSMLARVSNQSVVYETLFDMSIQNYEISSSTGMSSYLDVIGFLHVEARRVVKIANKYNRTEGDRLFAYFSAEIHETITSTGHTNISVLLKCSKVEQL